MKIPPQYLSKQSKPKRKSTRKTTKKSAKSAKMVRSKRRVRSKSQNLMMNGRKKSVTGTMTMNQGNPAFN